MIFPMSTPPALLTTTSSPTTTRTDGSGATLYAGLGADVSLGKQVYLSAEGRYSLGNAGVSGQYAAYDDIDLSRLQLIAGISLRW
jgi:hypothetical protein